MKVAIVHYHLRSGGVTNVVTSAYKAIQKSSGIRPVLVAGSAPQGDMLEFRHVPSLDYQDDPGTSSPIELANALLSAVPDADLWHVHNPTLGKNIHLPGALTELKRRGATLLLQIHDFAEDGRDEPRSRAPVYPAAHYVVLNRRDQRILEDAGLPKDLSHLLPNMVDVEPATPRASANQKQLLFYPARGIPRKNLGEALLLAAVSRSVVVASSAAPENPRWIPEFNAWNDFANELGLPVKLGVVGMQSPSDLGVNDCRDSSFESWIDSADRILTTSRSEGFGLTFLESYARGRLLLGRSLAALTSDFMDAGLSFPGLYQALEVPGCWVEGKPAGAIDFGSLGVACQRRVIRRLTEHCEAAAEVKVVVDDKRFTAERWITAQMASSGEELEENQRKIAEQYSPHSYATRLIDIYAKTRETSVNQASIAADKVRQAFETVSLK